MPWNRVLVWPANAGLMIMRLFGAASKVRTACVPYWPRRFSTNRPAVSGSSAPDVGGGFGMKGGVFPEDVLVVWAATRVARPVKWTGERGESPQSDTHARDAVAQAELGLTGTEISWASGSPPAMPSVPIWHHRRLFRP